MRGIVTVFTFVAVFVAIVAFMVSETPTIFTTTPAPGSSGLPSSTSTPTEFLAWNQSQTVNFTGAASQIQRPTIGGWNYEITSTNGVLYEDIRIDTYDLWGPFIVPWSYKAFYWYENNTKVSVGKGWVTDKVYFNIATLDASFAANRSLTYKITNAVTSATVNFFYNQTTYAKPSDAYNGGGLGITFNVEWGERNTSVNVLSFIGSMFTFSLPGIDTRIQMILMFPMLACLAYLIFIFVLRIVGAVFGGGGA